MSVQVDYRFDKGDTEERVVTVKGQDLSSGTAEFIMAKDFETDPILTKSGIVPVFTDPDSTVTITIPVAEWTTPVDIPAEKYRYALKFTQPGPGCGNRTRAARRLGLSRQSLHSHLRRLGIGAGAGRAGAGGEGAAAPTHRG